MVDISIDTICNICGKDVEAGYLGYDLFITPCEKCLEDKWQEGYETGIDEAEVRGE